MNLQLIEDAELRSALSQYLLDDAGRISNPGKMEGEPLYVPYFLDMALDGFADYDDDDNFVIDISDDDKKIFPALDGWKTITLEESDTGFVYHTLAR